VKGEFLREERCFHTRVGELAAWGGISRGERTDRREMDMLKAPRVGDEESTERGTYVILYCIYITTTPHTLENVKPDKLPHEIHRPPAPNNHNPLPLPASPPPPRL